MGTKNNPGSFDCYANAAPDEPMFVLLARDRHAPLLVREWANIREEQKENPAKVAEARKCAGDMEDWVERNRPNERPRNGEPGWLHELKELRAWKRHVIDVAVQIAERAQPLAFALGSDGTVGSALIEASEFRELQNKYGIACGAIAALKTEVEMWKHLTRNPR